MFDPIATQDEIQDLEKMIEDPGLWEDPKRASSLLSKRQNLVSKLEILNNAESELQDTIDMYDLAQAEGDTDVLEDTVTSLKNLEKKITEKSIEVVLSGDTDENDTYMEIQAGAGGTESQDWCSMLMRMYTRWAAENNYQLDIMQLHQGEEAGIKSVSLEIKGHNAYGWLKRESGVHRLVRISPFDSNARRHTSFASVWVYPVVDDAVDIEIQDDEVRVDTYRSSGAGGQHVNTTDSAVRITHIETGIVVQCQKERSQHKNRATAWKMLRARLYEYNVQKKLAENEKNADKKTDIGWGHQIRSYVLQPYQMVKDLRTQVEHSSPDAVLNGDINMFLRASVSFFAKRDT